MTALTTSFRGSLTHADPVPQHSRRSSRRFLVWAVGVVVIGMMLVAILLPSLCRSSETANRVKCASNLKQIGLAITDYAKSHGGEYPPSLAVLVRQDISPEVLTCPSSNAEASSSTDTAKAVAELSAAETNAPGHKDCLSYVYVGRGLNTNTATDRTIVAYEPLDNHDGDGTNVLFGDGHVEFEGKEAWTKIATVAGVTVVKSLTIRP